jgi:hypothetical protein
MAFSEHALLGKCLTKKKHLCALWKLLPDPQNFVHENGLLA